MSSTIEGSTAQGSTGQRPTIDPQATLAAIVDARPQAATVLQGLGLDFCCGGQQPLATAVAEAGLDLDRTIELLDRAPAGGSAWAGLGLAELVDHVEATHHEYLHRTLPQLDALAAKVAGVHGARHPELAAVRDLVTALRADLEPHLAKEERVLFPMIRELDDATTAPEFHCGTLRNPIAMMTIEHDRTGELLAELRQRTSGYAVPSDGCASYRGLYAGLEELEADTHLHVHKENNVLFPAAIAAERALVEALR